MSARASRPYLELLDVAKHFGGVQALSAVEGRVTLDGTPVAFRSPRDALEHRVAAIAQEPFVVPQLTVAENVFLGVEPRSAGIVRNGKLSDAYAALARTAGFELPGNI